MTTTATEIPTRWADLMDELCNLRPIKTKAAHRRAIAQIRQMIRIKKRTKDQSDYLDSLSGLVEQYEKALYPVPAHDPIGNLEFLMDQHGMNTSDLGKVIGKQGRTARSGNWKALSFQRPADGSTDIPQIGGRIGEGAATPQDGAGYPTVLRGGNGAILRFGRHDSDVS